MNSAYDSDTDESAAYLSDAEVDVLRKSLLGNSSAGGDGAVASRERRRDNRRPYPYRQLIAPVIEGRLPPSDSFGYVQCADIASGGFSFVASTPPGTNLFVVALGQPPQLVYLMAEVMHVSRIANEGERRYLVGCKYVGRAAY